MPPKKQKAAQRVLVDGLTEEQDELLRTVQYRQGNLSGRDSLYLSTRQHIEESASDVKQPTKMDNTMLLSQACSRIFISLLCKR